MQNIVLLSIKPEFAERIFSGEKKYEFRKTLFKSSSVKKIVVYASSPVKKIIGEFEIDCILSLKVDELWLKTCQHSGISKDFYDYYFDGKCIGHAIKIKNTVRYFKPKDLISYNLHFAPQSFIYLPDTQGKQLALL
ncbi:hypothetical protein [Nodosilinea sp. FACHB-13]|uniref:hypothetical protein n=1 Tax=Cyanophyceae TaxID=3028117 RepID=UPI001687C853|nr:hypothetical protein [Nodosilinea sp. FACHB-13]MBD2105530.1 hypothetical protein [Nodosilinea sp. FACHB-13]